MLRKRLIFVLIYNDGYFSQSRNFRLQRVGDIQWLETHYRFHEISFSIDELIVLDTSRKNRNISQFSCIMSRLSKNVFSPVSAGGGIRSLEDAKILFQHGADKLVLNSVIFNDVDLVKALVNQYGSQSVIASIDYKNTEDGQAVFIENGTIPLYFSLQEYIEHVESLKVGEIYLNCIDKDGTGFGYDMNTIQRIKKSVGIPLIIAGGAGNEDHLIEGLKTDDVNAVATANLFNFIGNGLPNARKKMLDSNINLASWCLDLS